MNHWKPFVSHGVPQRPFYWEYDEIEIKGNGIDGNTHTT